MKVNALLGLNESEESVSRAKLLKLKAGDKITGYFITRKKIKIQTLTLNFPASDRPPKDTSQMWEWIAVGSMSSFEIALGGEPDAYRGQFVVTKIANDLTEAKLDREAASRISYDDKNGRLAGSVKDWLASLGIEQEDVTAAIEKSKILRCSKPNYQMQV